MAVVLTASSTFNPATPWADSLLGGGTGIDFGVAVNGQWAPIISKVGNTGELNLWLSHNGINKITELKTHIQQYGTATGYTYGGNDTAANDYVTIKALGAASGSSKNNSDNLSGGLWMEMEWDVSTVNKFDRGARPTYVKVYGAAALGIDLATAFDISDQSMVYNSAGETSATAPVLGELGQSGNSTLGDRSHLQYRFMFPGSFSVGGTLQVEIVFTYAYTT
jgi:hypothetical protein